MKRLREIKYPLPIFGLYEDPFLSELQIPTYTLVIYSGDTHPNILIPLNDFNLIIKKFPYDCNRRFHLISKGVRGFV